MLSANAPSEAKCPIGGAIRERNLARAGGSLQTDKAQVAEVGRFISGAVKPVQKRGPKFRAPYSGYSLEQHTG